MIILQLILIPGVFFSLLLIIALVLVGLSLLKEKLMEVWNNEKIRR